jgi:hypothetical protein
MSGPTARRTAFRHMGLFQEHSVHWRFAKDQIRAAGRPVKVLNLFGYTGVGTLALAAKGARMTHVDASKKSVAEGKAINRAMGGHRPAVYAPKSALGHSVGAVGAVESILTVMALRDGVIPPTLNLRNLDPEIDLDVVAGEPRTGDFRYAVNNSFGFGGHNVAIAFGKY